MNRSRGSLGQPSRAPIAELSLPTFRLLSSLLHDYSGIVLADELLHKVERRLRARLYAIGVRSFEDYYRHLKYRDPEGREIKDGIELLTVHETYFFRELNQLAVFRDMILPEICRRKTRTSQRRLRIWCAGCSTGEEAYSVAMLVERSHLFRNWDVKIIGTDLSRRAINSAREGLYAEPSFRALPEDYYVFFERIGDQRFRVRERYRQLCSFLPHNLVAAEQRFVTDVDVILCRNVLIYFSLPTREKVVGSFFRTLRPGGYLLLGHSESLLNTSDAFQVDSFQDALTYRRPALPTSSNPPSARHKDRNTW